MDNFKDFIDILGDLGDLVKIFANNLYTTRPIKFAHFSFFLITLQVIENFAKCFAYLKWHGQGLFKNLYFIISGNFVLQTFLLYNWILQQKIQFLQICKFFCRFLK